MSQLNPVVFAYFLQIYPLRTFPTKFVLSGSNFPELVRSRVRKFPNYYWHPENTPEAVRPMPRNTSIRRHYFKHYFQLFNNFLLFILAPTLRSLKHRGGVQLRIPDGSIERGKKTEVKNLVTLYL